MISLKQQIYIIIGLNVVAIGLAIIGVNLAIAIIPVV